MRLNAITVGYKTREDTAAPAVIAGPEVPYAAQEEALDAAARADDGGGFLVIELWYNAAATRTVNFSTAGEKAAREKTLKAAATESTAAERAKARQREELLKQAEALGYDRKGPEKEAARAKVEAAAANAAKDAAEAALKALKEAAAAPASNVSGPDNTAPNAPPDGAEGTPGTAPKTSAPLPAPVSGKNKPS